MSKPIQNTQAPGPLNQFLFMLKAVAISYIVSVILLFPAALLANFQAYSNQGISILANIITAFGTALSGFLAGRNVGSKGIFAGAGCGIIYCIVLCLAGNLITKSTFFGPEFLTALIIGILCGSVGGIAGINTKKTKAQIVKR